jgi:hypothetical protein
MVAAHSCAIQSPKWSAEPKKRDVRNEGCTSEFIENKGVKKILLRVH